MNFEIQENCLRRLFCNKKEDCRKNQKVDFFRNIKQKSRPILDISEFLDMLKILEVVRNNFTLSRTTRVA